MNESADDIIPEAEAEITLPALEPPPAPPPRRKRKPIVIALGLGGLCLLAYWRFAALKSLFFALLPFAPVIITSLVAGGTVIFKDWNNYKPKWVRWALVMLVMAAWTVGIGYQVNQRQEKAAATALNQANIDELKGEVVAAQQAQDSNTKRFLGSLQTLSDKVSALQTKAATEALRTELAAVKGELEKTQKALAPAPKATLALTFPGYVDPAIGGHFMPLTEMTLPATAEGTIKVPLRVVNPTDQDALEGHFSIIVCNLCRFAKDPDRFRHLKGTPETERYIDSPAAGVSQSCRNGDGTHHPPVYPEIHDWHAIPMPDVCSG